MTDNAIHIAVRPWSNNEDFAEVCSDVFENVKEKFDKSGIVVQPFVRESSK